MGLKPVYRVQAGSRPMPRMDAEQVPGAPTGPTGQAYPQPFRAASTTRRLVGWRPSNSGPNSVVSLSAPELLRRSRDLRRNNPHGKKAMDLYATHIVGTGIKPRSLCTNTRVRTKLTELFADWSKVADADGQSDFYGLQALAVSEMAEGGEIFARMRTRRLSDGLPVPFQIQLLPAEQLPLTWSVSNCANLVRQGIERDGIGNRVGYWFYPENPTDLLATGAGIDMQPGRVDAADVAHMFLVARIGQLRGLPWLGAAIPSLFQVNDYLDAELLRKQLAAANVGFVEQATPEDPTAGDMGAFGNTSVDQDGGIAVSMEPGTIQYLEPGQKVTFNAPADVGGSFDPFLAANFRAIAAAAGHLYEELTGDYSKINDRTFRAAFNTFKRQFRMLQYNIVVTQLCEPVWHRFIDYAVASGALPVPKSVADADLRRVDWVTDRWEYLQPVQDIEATGLEMGLGLKSRTTAAAERGDDIEVVDKQIADDKKREAGLGLAFGSGLAKASASPDLSGVDQSGAVTPSASDGAAPAGGQGLGANQGTGQ